MFVLVKDKNNGNYKIVNEKRAKKPCFIVIEFFDNLPAAQQREAELRAKSLIKLSDVVRSKKKV